MNAFGNILPNGVTLPIGSTTAPALATAGTKSAGDAKARAASVDFEGVFLNSMFSQMFTGIDGEGPFGAGPAVGIWRSFLTEQYAQSFAKAGGIGIADHVYRALIAQQEANPS
jgi:flagellar protein FlgJ